MHIGKVFEGPQRPVAALFVAIAVLTAPAAQSQERTALPQVGPENGSLVVVGGAI